MRGDRDGIHPHFVEITSCGDKILHQTDSKSISFTKAISHVKHSVTACRYKTARTTDAELLACATKQTGIFDSFLGIEC